MSVRGWWEIDIFYHFLILKQSDKSLVALYDVM